MDGPAPIVLIATVAVYVALAVTALRNRLLMRVAVREAIRRPVQTALVVAGLTVGTGAILGPQVWYDSITDSLIGAAYREWGRVDLTVSAGGALFDAGVADRIASQLSHSPSVAGVQAGLDLTGAVSHPAASLALPAVRIVGFDPATQGAFGAYVLENGTRTDGAGLAPGEVILSRSLADSIQAGAGDRIRVSVNGHQTDVTVANVARPEGPGLQSLRPAMFAPLSTAADISGSDQINVVRITAIGDGQAETDAARAAGPAVRAAVADLSAGPALGIREVKAEQALAYTEYAANSRWVFMGPSLVVVFIGSALVVNLILSVADERRPQLAILRALGLSRSGLVKLSLLEGGLYGIAAAIVSLATGGLIAGLMFAYSANASIGDVNGRDVVFEPSVRPETVGGAIALGALITLITVFVGAVRTSRMTIASAIRDLPEPEPLRRRSWLRPILLAGLTVAGTVGLLATDPRFRLVGGCAIIAVGAALTRGRLTDRTRATVVGLLVAVWSPAVYASFGVTADDLPTAIQLYLAGLLTTVVGLSLVLAANLRALEGIAALPGTATSGLRATLRPPLAYMTRRPLRAGMSISVLAAVIATLTVWVVLEGGGLDYAQDSGGYDVAVTLVGTRLEELPAPLNAQVARSIAFPTRRYVAQERFRFPSGAIATNWHEVVVPLYELSDAVAKQPLPRLTQRDSSFSTDAEAYKAVASDPTWVFSSWWGGNGGKVALYGRDGPVEFKVAGVLPFGMLDGIVGSPRALGPFTEIAVGTTLLVKGRDGVEPDALALAIRRSMYSQGVEAVTTRELLDEGQVQSHAWSAIFRLLGELGLVAGILSIGVLALRSVLERRRAIGVLRALGSQRRSILAGVLLEAMLTTGLAVAIGLAAGLESSYFYWVAATKVGTFSIDLGHAASSLALIYGLLLVVTVIVTAGPAVMASRLAPVDALRQVD